MPVDRNHLAQLLAERELRSSQSAQSAAPPLVAADVFVFSSLASDAGQAWLQIDAVHGPTTALLGELKLPVDAAAPLKFTPPLEQTVARWWPGVLQRLADVPRETGLDHH